MHGSRRSPPKSFCEIFAGIGLVREGLVPSGWQCVYAIDIDPKKQEMYLARFRDVGHLHLGDVHETDQVVARIPEPPFLATASFPCTDLSLAGHRRGLLGAHSSAYYGFIRALQAMQEKRPKLVLLENVVGWLTCRDGQDFALATTALAELGYWLDAIVVDARHFVPQSRPRVFVVGVHETLHVPFARRQNPTDGWATILDARPRVLMPPRLASLLRTVSLPTGWTAFNLPAPEALRQDLAGVIDVEQQEWWDEAAVRRELDTMSDRHRTMVDDLRKAGTCKVGTIYRRTRHGTVRAEVRFDGLAGCLRTPRGGAARQIVIVVDGGRVRMRWMSAREYARLQGAPDYPLGPRATQAMYGVADAVCVPVIRWIDRQILSPVYDAVSQERLAPVATT